ncbi:MAG: isochorismatase family protein [Blastococcus sp.]|nr:isochorismatase family protein [Blastococcus sp.]
MSGLEGWDPARTAFLVLDCQNDICHERGAFTGPIAGQIRGSGVFDAIGACLAATRAAGVLVVHVRHLVDPWLGADAQEGSRVLRGMRRLGVLVPGTWGAQIVDEVAPVDGEPVVDKYRISAFAGTDLDRMLRQSGVDSLVLSGVSTSFVVEGTARDAVDRGFRTAVVADGCVDLQEESHRVALRHVLPMLTTVTDTAAVAGWLGAVPASATTR